MSKPNEDKKPPAWIADVRQTASRYRHPQWDRWPAEVRKMLDDLIHHMRETGSYWSPHDVGERLTRELAERGINGTHGKPLLITQNMITAYCVRIHNFKWSSMRP